MGCFTERFDRLERKVDTLLLLARHLVKEERKMAAKLDDLLADVTAEGTALDSVKALIQGLKDQLANAGLSPADQAKVDAIMAQLQSNDQKIADALAANVPPAPPAPTP